MTAWRFFLIIVIFAGASFAWLILGGTIEYRTASLSRSLSAEVDSLWGPSGLAQAAPFVEPADGTGTRLLPSQSDVTVHFAHRNRYKGLLWFSTYTVDFSGAYKVLVKPQRKTDGTFVLRLPPGVPFFEDLAVTVDGKPYDLAEAERGDNTLLVRLPGEGDVTDAELMREVERLFTAGNYKAAQRRLEWIDRAAVGYWDRGKYDALRTRVREAVESMSKEQRAAAETREHVISVHYKTRGRDRWTYVPATESEGRPVHLKNFTMTATMDFRAIDYPRGTLSPTTPAEPFGGGMKAVWYIGDARTCQQFGIEMPGREDAGPIAGRMAFYAPVGLLFFFTVLFTTMLLKKVPLHPMHYLFISAGFFAFHILLAYLVDKIDIHQAFWVSAAVSVLLVVSYMRLVAGVKFAVAYVGLAQLVYLIGFSYAFFWKGWTGLSIVIVAIVTLFILMQATARVVWNEVFKRKTPSAPPSVPPSAA